jgi:hypothetical protein
MAFQCPRERRERSGRCHPIGARSGAQRARQDRECGMMVNSIRQTRHKIKVGNCIWAPAAIQFPPKGGELN